MSNFIQECLNIYGQFPSPTPSELTTIAGRIFLISAPTVGSKLANQTSPRLGTGNLIVNYISCL
jgi:hypothetical protein